MFRDEDVEMLMKLGLTLLQAKIFLTLSLMGSSTTGAVSKVSGIARQDVYRIMPALQKLGIVEKVVRTPATYKALQMREGLSLLLEKKKEDYDVLKKKAAELIDNLNKSKRSNAIEPQDDAQFAIIYDQTLLYQKYEKFNLLATKSIDCSGNWQGIRWLMSLCDCETDLFTQAMKKNVRIRILTEERGADYSADKNIEGMSRNPLFGIRFVPTPMSLTLVLYDEKEAYTSISKTNNTSMPMLWSNNPNFVRIMSKQFDDLWNKGTGFRHQAGSE